jgi:hypothetical protein
VATLKTSFIIGDDILAQAAPGATPKYLLYDGTTRHRLELKVFGKKIRIAFLHNHYRSEMSNSSMRDLWTVEGQ